MVKRCKGDMVCQTSTGKNSFCGHTHQPYFLKLNLSLLFQQAILLLSQLTSLQVSQRKIINTYGLFSTLKLSFSKTDSVSKI